MKKFSESVSESNKIIPLYSKGEILIFTDEDLDFMSQLLKKSGLNLKSDWEFGDRTYIVETPIGQEDKIGQSLVEDYPEFIQGYERRDLRLEFLFKEFEDIQELLSEAEELLSNRINTSREKIGTRFPENKPFNDKIDQIIKKLNAIKQ